MVRGWIAALMLMGACPALAGTQAGVAAWQRGDYKRAVAEWRAPAIAGDAAAQFNLGQAYKLGRGVPADPALSLDWYRKAAVQGYPPAEDNYALALFQAGRAKDALPWLEKSATRGEPRSLYVLGMIHFNADIVPQDRIRAYTLMTRAMAAGLAPAATALAQMDTLMPLAERQRAIAMAREPRQPAAKASLPGAATGPWRIQLGTFRNPAGARRLWSEVAPRFPGRQPRYARSGAFTRLLVGPFASRAAAANACAEKNACIVTR